jgi:outer membrane lipoprotein-sorting protein
MMIVAILLGLAAQDDAGPAALRRLEERIEKAKTVRLVFQGVGRKGDEEDQVEGTLEIKAGGRFRYEVRSARSKASVLAVSDGKKFFMGTPARTGDQETPEDVQSRLAVAFCRTGALNLLLAVTAPPGDPRKMFDVTDLAAGPDDGAAKTLTFRVKGMEGKLWVDPKTGAPLRRTVTFAPQKLEIRETYVEFLVDSEIPDERFKLTHARGPKPDEAERPAPPAPLPDVGNYPPPPAGWKKLRVGVLEFRDPAKTRLGGAAAQQLGALATMSGRFTVVEGSKLKELLKEKGLDASAAAEDLAKSGKLRDLDALLAGEVTHFRLATPRPWGILPATPGLRPLDVDTSRTTVAADAAVELRLIRVPSGETAVKQPGEVKREATAASWGMRVLAISGDATNNIQVDVDSQARVIRFAVDDALKKLLPQADEKLGR